MSDWAQAQCSFLPVEQTLQPPCMVWEADSISQSHGWGSPGSRTSDSPLGVVYGLQHRQTVPMLQRMRGGLLWAGSEAFQGL